MSEWQKAKIGNFLKVRQGKYKPDDDAIADLKRLNKIDFSGCIYLSDKPTKTDMIIVNSGDLVISGINVAKGAIAVHQGSEPITATIHYSAYEFDESKIDIDFLKRFLKSPAFISALQEQTKGGIKTEIKAKTLLSIVVQLPSLSEQKTINKRFDSFENELIELDSEISNQKTYLTQLRQAILQEAIEGKLTADWRVKNPVQKGNPDHDAQALLETIKAEKQKLIADGKIKKDKPLAPITPDDVPFALPDGWVWVRLNGLINPQRALTYGIVKMGNEPKSGGVKALRCSDVRFRFIDNSKIRCVSEKISEQFSRTVLAGDEILLNVRGTLGGCAITDKNHVGFNIAREVSLIVLMNTKLNRHILNVLTSPFFNRVIEDNLRGIAYKGLNLNLLSNFLIPLPPLAEQNAIVERVDHLLESVNALELQVQERKSYAQQLMQAVLKEAFAG